MSTLVEAIPEQREDAIDMVDNALLDDVLTGLAQQQKTLPCKYFYDEKGSQLFEAICETPEYYVTRTEISIYQCYASEMAAYIGDKALIIEPGAGSVKKISYLLAALDQPVGFIPMDISPEILQVSSKILTDKFPDLDISPTVVDFSDENALSAIFQHLPLQPLVNKRVVFFPGSTIGNFKPADAVNFLQQFSQNLHTGDGLLIGVDLVKDHDILEAAYDDQGGVTADFNLNLLTRINAELGADFMLDDFSHKAVFNQRDSRIEMHLVSDCEQEVTIANQTVRFDKDETIHTENSYKYTQAHFTELAAEAGFKRENIWVDKNSLFSVYYFSVK